MNTKTFFPFIAVLAVVLIGIASALTSSVTTTFNDVTLGSSVTMAGETGETVPVRVTFAANTNADDVRVKVWIDGQRDDAYSTTGRFSILSGSTYSKLLSVKLPSDLKDLSKTFILNVAVVNADGRDEVNYAVKIQRVTYSSDILSVDYDQKVAAGSVVPVSVVVENNGMQDIDNGYVVVTIPSLGISTRGYFGDLVALENCTDNCNQQDATQKTVSLKIPESATAGVYEMVVKVYDKDSITTSNQLISVEDSVSTSLIASVKSQDIKMGETKKYDLIIVNSGKGIKVYNIQAVSGNGLSVSVPSVVTVGSDSSITVPVSVTATNDAEKGSNAFTVTVNGQVVSFNANVTGSAAVSNSVLALTVILVVIFVVLLIVLIVLLTRKEKQPEQVETSYY